MQTAETAVSSGWKRLQHLVCPGPCGCPISHVRNHRSQCLSPKENPNCLIWCPSCTKGNSTLAVQRSALPLWFAASAGHDPRTGAQSSLHNPGLICPRGGPSLGSLKLLIHLAHILKQSSHNAKVREAQRQTGP